MKAKHTPEPWVAIGYEVRQLGGRMIAYTGPHHTPPDEYPTSCRLEDEANAIVIALVPDCIKALQAAEDFEKWIANADTECPFYVETVTKKHAYVVALRQSSLANFSSASAEPGTAGGHNS